MHALFGKKQIKTPGVIQIPRPGGTQRRKVEKDPGRIRAFFEQLKG